MREKLKTLLAEYGRIAVWTYLVIWVLVLAGFAFAISVGFKPSTAGGGAGVLFSAWAATKLTQPLRIAATLGLTPVVATLVRRVRGKSQSPVPPTSATQSKEESSAKPDVVTGVDR